MKRSRSSRVDPPASARHSPRCSPPKGSTSSSPRAGKSGCAPCSPGFASDTAARVELIVEDLEQPDAPARLCSELEARGLKIDVLVNNAGYGVPGSYLSSSWEVHSRFLQIMVTAVAELTYRLLPGMIGRRHGRIINVASLAGLVPSPAGHTLYAAAKAFLIKFSESLAHEVRRHGVLVTAVCPGFTSASFTT